MRPDAPLQNETSNDLAAFDSWGNRGSCVLDCLELDWGACACVCVYVVKYKRTGEIPSFALAFFQPLLE